MIKNMRIPIQLKESDFKQEEKYFYRCNKNGWDITIALAIYEGVPYSEIGIFLNNDTYKDFTSYELTTLQDGINEINEYFAEMYTALTVEQEPCEVCKEVKNLWGSPNIDINGYDYCPYCGRKLEVSK